MNDFFFPLALGTPFPQFGVMTDRNPDCNTFDLHPLKDGKVTFTYRDSQDNNKLKEMTLDVDEFIRRFLLFTLPERFIKIRYFGFLSHRVKKESVERIRSLADPDFQMPETREETMSRLIGEDVCLCPKCRKGRMTRILEQPKPKIPQRRVIPRG